MNERLSGEEIEDRARKSYDDVRAKSVAEWLIGSKSERERLEAVDAAWKAYRKTLVDLNAVTMVCDGCCSRFWTVIEKEGRAICPRCDRVYADDIVKLWQSKL